MAPFIRLAWDRPFTEQDAFSLLPDRHDAYALSEQFERALGSERERAAMRGTGLVPAEKKSMLNPTTRALMRIWWPTLLTQLLWASIETGSR